MLIVVRGDASFEPEKLFGAFCFARSSYEPSHLTKGAVGGRAVPSEQGALVRPFRGDELLGEV